MTVYFERLNYKHPCQWIIMHPQRSHMRCLSLSSTWDRLPDLSMMTEFNKVGVGPTGNVDVAGQRH